MAGWTGVIHNLLSSIDVTTGNKWSREHERALFITGRNVQLGGGGTVAQHPYIIVHNHNTLSLLSGENLITPLLMIFVFLPELEDSVTLYKFHALRTLKSRWIIYKTSTAVKVEMRLCRVISPTILTFWKREVYNASQIITDGTRENAHTPLGGTEDGGNQFKSTSSHASCFK